jgi:hypothetical protein
LVVVGELDEAPPPVGWEPAETALGEEAEPEEVEDCARAAHEPAAVISATAKTSGSERDMA